MKYSTIYYDFNGVLSHDRFFRHLETSNPMVYYYIQNKIFGPNNGDIINQWMRAEVSVHDIVTQTAINTGTDENVIYDALVYGTDNFIIDTRHLEIISTLRSKGIKVILCTDNMDIFDDYLVPRFQFHLLFDYVVNSYPNKKLKKDGLFNIARNKAGDVDFSQSLLIEDALDNCDYFKSLGGESFNYTSFETFFAWAEKKLLN